MSASIVNYLNIYRKKQLFLGLYIYFFNKLLLLQTKIETGIDASLNENDNNKDMSASLLFPLNHVRGSDLIVSMTMMIILGMETQEYAEKMESLLFDARCCCC